MYSKWQYERFCSNFLQQQYSHDTIRQGRIRERIVI